MALDTAITSDIGILDLLRKLGPLSVLRLAELTSVTPTAVRQRLARLTTNGMIERAAERKGRGRPSHRYSLTDKGRRQTGANFIDLALALWQEIREIKDPEVRRGLLARISTKLAAMYADQVGTGSTEERMHGLTALFAERNVPFTVEQKSDAGGTKKLPVLTALACPYPQLAERDRSICALEKMMFSEVLGTNVRLTDWRLEGGTCCRFETGERDFAAPALTHAG